MAAPAGCGKWLDGSFEWETALPDPTQLGRPLSRIKSRSFLETMVEIACVSRKLVGDDFESAILYLALLQLADLEGKTNGRPIHINALARSLKQPFETVRRRCNALLKRGWIARGEQGLYLTPEILSASPAREIVIEVHDRLIAMIERLVSLGVEMPQSTGEAISHAAISKAALDLALVVVEYGMPWHPCYTEGVVFSAIMTASTQDFSYIPEVAYRYAEQNTPPPEGLRRAIHVSAIARGLNLSYPTTRRHAERLVVDGSLVRRTDGLIVSVERLQAPRSLATSDIFLQFLERALNYLARNGFPFHDLASAYLGTRPERIIFR